MIRIVLADDHKLFAEGVAKLLATDPELVVEGIFENGYQLIEYLSKNDADIALVDLNMPKMDGFEAITRLRQVKPSCKAIVLSMYADEDIFKKAEKAAVDDYLLKDVEPDELVYTVKEVHDGHYVLNFEHVVSQTVPANFNDDFAKKYKLSKREVEIVRLVAHGLTNNDIADKLFLSVYTVQTHRRNIIEKLDVKNTAELVNLVGRLGI